jgi:hypothetical protein
MVSPFLMDAIFHRIGEEAVAFAKAGNTKLNKNRRTINAVGQEIEMTQGGLSSVAMSLTSR